MKDAELERVLTNGRASWVLSLDHDTVKRTLIVTLTACPETLTPQRSFRFHDVSMMEIRWHERDDECLEGFLGVHQTKNDAGYQLRIVTEQREIEFYTRGEPVVDVT